MDSKKAKITDEHREEARKLRAIWDERKPATQAVFAEKYGIGNQAAVGNFLAGRSALSLKAAVGFASGLNCEISDFSPRLARVAAAVSATVPYEEDGNLVAVADQDTPPAGYIRLQHLPYQPSMGPGRAQVPEHIVQHIDVLESFVRQKVGTVSADRIKILTGVGTSMLPRIKDQDIVFVDIEHRWIDAPGYYVIDVGGLLLLKKAMILSTGTLILRSENIEEYPDEERHDLRKAAETITVCGKVLAWWTLMQG